MHAVTLAHPVDMPGWRAAARALALNEVPPERVVWSVREATDLFAERAPPLPSAPEGAGFAVPRALLELAEQAIQARDPERFALLYKLVWRARWGERRLAEDAADPDILRATRWMQAVRREIHKMHAFVRFRAVEDDGATRHVAWFEPEHFIVEAAAPFFVRRFATMRWSILTPYRGAHWNGDELLLGEGASRAGIPDDDRMAAYWRTYFSAIFNPARLKTGAMLSEMPKRYWRNLPEAEAIPALIRGASARAQRMVETPVLSPPRPLKRPIPGLAPLPDAMPAPDSLEAIRARAAACRRCALWEHATQMVFGEGPPDARIMVIGEQPGDQEDLAGRPFVGPAGQLLDRAMAEAGLDRSRLYVTNAVKHFKFTPRNRRRIHATPDAGEIRACNAWLALERRLVRPEVTILLGASAARAVLGRAVAIGRERSRPMPAPDGGQMLVTTHPSYLLRLPDEAAKRREYAAFVADLRQAAELSR